MSKLLETQERVDIRKAERNAADARLFAAEEAFKKGRAVRYGIQQRLNAVTKQHVETSTALFEAMVGERDAVAKPLRSQLANLAADKSVLMRAMIYWDHWTGRDLESAMKFAEIEAKECAARFHGEYGCLLQEYVATKVAEINSVDKNWKVVPNGPGQDNAESEKIKAASHSLFLEAGSKRAELIEFDKATLQGRMDNAKVLN